jgi:hypothetical protein
MLAMVARGALTVGRAIAPRPRRSSSAKPDDGFDRSGGPRADGAVGGVIKPLCAHGGVARTGPPFSLV